MNTCKNCIHRDLCKDMHKFGVVDLPYNDDGTCEHYKGETDALHTLRLIYADFFGSANRCRTKAEISSMFSRPSEASSFRREADIFSACASRVKSYCRRIGFDPAAEREVNK